MADEILSLPGIPGPAKATPKWRRRARRVRTPAQNVLNNAKERRRRRLFPEKTKTKDRATYNRRMETLRGRGIRLLQGVRGRAKKDKIEYNLDIDWLMPKLESGTCEATGILFEWERAAQGSRIWSPFTASIDRRDRNQGYIKENCRVVVWIFNIAKGPYTDADVLRMCNGLVRASAT